MYENRSHKEEAEYAHRMLARADRILAQVDEAFIIKQRHHRIRAMPVFRPEEISLGPVLGTGGFGIVTEIKAFYLDPVECLEAENARSQDSDSGSEVAVNHQDTITTAILTAPKEETKEEREKRHKRRKRQVWDNDNHVHYDIFKAREYMKSRATKSGVARYALKRLHGGLTELERARGMIDLAVEAKYLAVVWHPNIVKMRGMAKGPMVDPDFFIIMDRLFDTLDVRTKQWRSVAQKSKGVLFGIGKKAKQLKQLMVDRMTVAYDLAAAYFYLHENRIVFRDIKPENIGFDARGDVKVFDFGLCKSLHTHLKSKDGYGYRLTGRAGSLPYMAPEVVKMETYDTKCDVFSFAILLWEILALESAFKGYSPTQFVKHVTIGKERLELAKSWPPLTRLMLPEAWDNDPQKRPDMKRVAIMIRGDLNDMTTDETILRRTNHMDNRSQHLNEEGM